MLSAKASVFLLGFGVWSWVIWPTFLTNIAKDPRSWGSAGGPTAFFSVHLVLVVASLALGTAIGLLGWRGWRASRKMSAGQG